MTARISLILRNRAVTGIFLNLVTLPVRRDVDLPRLIRRQDVVLHSFNGLRFTVDQKRTARRARESAQPAENFAVVAMRRKTVDDVNLSANRIILAVYPYLTGSFGK